MNTCRDKKMIRIKGEKKYHGRCMFKSPELCQEIGNKKYNEVTSAIQPSV